MSSIYSGVQARITDWYPLTQYCPCASHSLNLVGVAAAERDPTTVTFSGVLQKAFTFLSEAPAVEKSLNLLCQVVYIKFVQLDGLLQ